MVVGKRRRDGGAHLVARAQEVVVADVVAVLGRLEGREWVTLEVESVQEGVYTCEHLVRLGWGEEAVQHEIAVSGGMVSGNWRYTVIVHAMCSAVCLTRHSPIARAARG